MQNIEDEKIRQAVRKAYGDIAASGQIGCGCGPTSCCGDGAGAQQTSEALGYSQDDVSSVPVDADMGLGCGNPQKIASLQPGETVLDLGSGPGFDCLLAARAVGPTGHVIGVDMTAEMVSKAREVAANAGCENVEFRLGEIENLPVADNAVDVIISNCVINLSPAKPRVFAEAFRVLRPGGRVAVTDVVAIQPLPKKLKEDIELYAGCVAGAALVDDLKSALEDAGFADVRIEPLPGSKETLSRWVPGSDIADYVVSATIQAVKRVGSNRRAGADQGE
jgi:SAM-dependent methyltransferase